MTTARHVRVSGIVQGVFFRAWTQQEAERLGVRGWVRNCSDGSVEAHLEGEQDGIDRLVEALRHGPPSARVEDLSISDAQPEGLGAFEIRR